MITRPSPGRHESTSNTPAAPKILPWLAHEAGVADARALSLWATSCRHATALGLTQGSPEYWEQAMSRLHALMEIESLHLDQKFALRRWARLQRKLSTLQITWMDASITVASRLQCSLQQRNCALTPCC